MEPIYLIVIIITAVIAVLNIILFFKIWGACNNIAKMKDTLTALSSTVSKTSGGFKVGDHVILKKENRELIIDRINNVGEYVCINTSGATVGTFKEAELTK